MQDGTIGFLAAGIGLYQGLAPKWFPTPPGGGFNVTRMLLVGIVGGVLGAVGAAIGKLVETVRR